MKFLNLVTKKSAFPMLFIGVAVAGCLSIAPNQRSESADTLYLSAMPLGINPGLPEPWDNHLTAEKTDLGERLFFDTRLSRDGTVSCSTCHLPEKAFSDGQAIALGIDDRLGRRNAPTLLNRAYMRSQFWDGRAASLEEQALMPMINPSELDNTHEEIVRRLELDEEYGRLFEAAFGSEEIVIEHVARAIASFERTLLSGNSAFDRYEILGETRALSESARRGLELFRGQARCHLCHERSLFSDGLFHNTGVSWGELPIDLGRYEVTEEKYDQAAFRTPSLRDVEHTAPYMHDGSIETLEDVLEFYSKGGNPNPYLDLAIKPLDLSDREMADLVEFLKSLSGSNWQTDIGLGTGGGRTSANTGG